MVGRAANGKPWIFDAINEYMKSGTVLPDPPLEERLKVLMRQIELMQKYKAERTVILEARKHTAWYMKGVKNAAKLRKMCADINNLHDVEIICEKALAEGEDI